MALDNDLEGLPVLNKIDLPSAEPDRVAEEIEGTSHAISHPSKG